MRVLSSEAKHHKERLLANMPIIPESMDDIISVFEYHQFVGDIELVAQLKEAVVT